VTEKSAKTRWGGSTGKGTGSQSVENGVTSHAKKQRASRRGKVGSEKKSRKERGLQVGNAADIAASALGKYGQARNCPSLKRKYVNSLFGAEPGGRHWENKELNDREVGGQSSGETSRAEKQRGKRFSRKFFHENDRGKPVEERRKNPWRVKN